MAHIFNAGNEHPPSQAGPMPLRPHRISKEVKSNFTFFNISHPSEVKSTQRRKQVRSHITREQHRRRKLPLAIRSSQAHALLDASLQAKEHQVASLPTSPVPLEHSDDSIGSESRKRRRLATPSSTGGASTDSQASIADAKTDQRRDMGQATSRHVIPHPTLHTIVRNDPFTTYQVPWQPWYDRLLHHMMKVFAPRGWPSLTITNEQGVDWEYFMTQKAMGEPALLYVRLLFASGDMVRLGVLERERTYSLHLHAIKAINEALSDSERCVSDGLILAVGRIALHEFMYGDRTAANQIHRPAQRRMIDLRGGMMALGFPDLVKRLMRWADRVMSLQGNTPRLLPDEEDLDNQTFGMQQSLNVLDAWAPDTGRAVRKRVDEATLQRE